MTRAGLVGVVLVLMASLGVVASEPSGDVASTGDALRAASRSVPRTATSPRAEAPFSLDGPSSSPSTKPSPPHASLGSAYDATLGAAESPAVDDAGPVATTPPVDTAITDQGWELALGRGPEVGAGGPLVTYRVEREPGIDVPMNELLPTVVSALEDPDHGWTASGERRLQRVDRDAQIRVVLASPATVDAHCARAGLRTNGRYSCWVGDTAMLSALRWQTGATDFDDVAVYRTYLVNHEVGHGLGLGHARCPAPGAPAPVMMQQTKSTGACTANGWPHQG